MWPDPFDPKRRRPSFMKGTPTNLYSFLVPAAGVVVVFGLIKLLSYIPYVQRQIEKVEQDTIARIPLRQARALESDPLIGNALKVKRSEHEISNIKAWMDMH